MHRNILKYSLLAIFISFISACGGGDDDTQEVVNCTLPCLESAPTLDKTTVKSDESGIIKITLNLKGDISNIGEIFIHFVKTDLEAGIVGEYFVASDLNITERTITYEISYSAGSYLGDFYPEIKIVTKDNPNNSSLYFFDISQSNTHYTYLEFIEGMNASVGKLTTFQAPILTVTP